MSSSPNTRDGLSSPAGRVLMVQGTASHVGKSVLVSALCRILRQDGFRVGALQGAEYVQQLLCDPRRR